ncbi:MAG: diaminopimelate epimerase [Deltaproteobacteria bacterium]|nr:diaminopimelate epimerase [Deltaproteobacteria bacterium]
MEIKFTKMHGLGNDFIVIDLRKRGLRNLPSVVRRLSDRRFGIGFDQALIMRGSKKADFRMDIYNSDGGRAEMCGNGIRCFARYIWERELNRKAELKIETMAGIITPLRVGKNLIRVNMGRPLFEAGLIPVRAKGSVIDRPLKAGDRRFDIICVSMGNPHCVVFVKGLDRFPVGRYGPLIEKDRFFPQRTNVEFVEVVNKKNIRMRVWERGSGETPACGTGACAAAVASHLKGFTRRSVRVTLKGGSLKIDWAKDGHIYMTGPAEEVFEGTAVV